jgi:putative SOS response-associated peptidase YedK
MCGRYTLSTPSDAIGAQFGVDVVPELKARFNIAPSQEAIIVAQPRDGARRCGWATWGLEPPWKKQKPGSRGFINARIETVEEKPAFRASFARRRCLIPADGFYEWKQQPDGKVPVFFSLRDGRAFAFAGIWNPPADKGNPPSFALLTTRPNSTVAAVHDRMPVILEPGLYADWLDREPPATATLDRMARPCPDEDMRSWQVSTFVNSPAHDSPDCIARIGS